VVGAESGLTAFRSPALNDGGSVVFIGSHQQKEGVFTAGAGTLTTVAEPGVFALVYAPSISSAGRVAFRAARGWPRYEGIYIGGRPEHDKVIEEGDLLFGSTLRHLQYIGNINDHGHISFTYELDNGVSGVAIAVISPQGAAPAAPLSSPAESQQRE
jgi:hypothetical protein